MFFSGTFFKKIEKVWTILGLFFLMIQSLSAAGCGYVNYDSKPDYPPFSPLFEATRNNDSKLVQKLLDKGADLNETYPKVSHGFYGVVLALQPINVAAEAGHSPMVKLLLTNGANVDSYAPCGNTPLLSATELN